MSNVTQTEWPRALVQTTPDIWRCRRARISGALRRVLPALLFCLIVTASWEIASRVMATPLMPGVAEIATEVRRIVNGFAFQQIGLTTWRITLGFAAAFVSALVAGIATARSEFCRAFFEPAIVLGLTVPSLVWALLCVIWFGVSLPTPVVAIALAVAPALTLQVVQGMRAVDAGIVEMIHIYKFTPWMKLRHVWIPVLVPYLISGARLGLSLAWKVIVLVELFGMSSGVGYQLNSEFGSMNVAGVLAWTIVFWAVMAAIEFGFLRALERRSTVWHRATRL